MPSCECGNKIRWRDILNPFKITYKVDVVDKDGKVIETFRVCEHCGEMYMNLVTLINFYGEEKVFELLEEMDDENKEGVD